MLITWMGRQNAGVNRRVNEVEEFSFLQEKMILGSIARRYLSGTVEQLKAWYQKWILFGTPLPPRTRVNKN
jgi:hypothetical protein